MLTKEQASYSQNAISDMPGEAFAFNCKYHIIPTPTAITSNLQHLRLPKAVPVAELTINDKDVIAQAQVAFLQAQPAAPEHGCEDGPAKVAHHQHSRSS